MNSCCLRALILVLCLLTTVELLSLPIPRNENKPVNEHFMTRAKGSLSRFIQVKLNPEYAFGNAQSVSDPEITGAFWEWQTIVLTVRNHFSWTDSFANKMSHYFKFVTVTSKTTPVAKYLIGRQTLWTGDDRWIKQNRVISCSIFHSSLDCDPQSLHWLTNIFPTLIRQ